MANQEHLEVLKQGVDVWNEWRKEHPEIYPDLSYADLHEVDLTYADLSKSNLFKANLHQANLSQVNFSNSTLRQADLRWTDLHQANLGWANLSEANLTNADLTNTHLDEATLFRATLIRATLTRAILYGAYVVNASLSDASLNNADLRRATLNQSYLRRASLSEANLTDASLKKADLGNAHLEGAILIRADLTEANLTKCSVYGISVWDVQLEEAIQDSLVITQEWEPTITVDNLEVAQFIYLLLNNKKIRDVIDTITSKLVLILGRFTPERKIILDAIKNELRKRNYSPVLFDFEKPANRDITETVSTLAHMARFVIADITDAKSIPQELMVIVPNLPSVPVQPLILTSQLEYGMFEHFSRYSWVLPVYRYTDETSLLQSLQEKVITPAEQKAKDLAQH